MPETPILDSRAISAFDALNGNSNPILEFRKSYIASNYEDTHIFDNP